MESSSDPRRDVRRISNLMGVDDAPFERAHRGDVQTVGAVFTQHRLDGVIIDRVRRDGVNATDRVASMLEGSRFDEHVRGVVIGGIALAGFNVIDIHALADRLSRPVLVVARKEPDLRAIRRALFQRVPGGPKKWKLVEKAGPMEALEGVWVQRAGLTSSSAARLLSDSRVQGMLPEPIRVAHLIAGALALGVSHGSA